MQVNLTTTVTVITTNSGHRVGAKTPELGQTIMLLKQIPYQSYMGCPGVASLGWPLIPE